MPWGILQEGQSKKVLGKKKKLKKGKRGHKRELQRGQGSNGAN